MMIVRLSIFGLVFALASGCQHGANRNLKQPVVQEFNAPPKIAKFTNPPTYPDEKREILTADAKQKANAPLPGANNPGGGAGPGALSAGGVPGQR